MAEQPNGGIELRDLRKIEEDGFLHPAACTPHASKPVEFSMHIPRPAT
jgi:hypothetical protein